MNAILNSVFQVFAKIDFGITDFYPPVMGAVIWSGVCVYGAVHGPHGLDLGNV
jgi:hypothetical protein